MNTLRNQILLVYLLAMVAVLLLVSGVSYNIVLSLIQEKAESQIQQTAREATGRIESLYQQINNISIQVATHPEVQQLLTQEMMNRPIRFSERQSLMETMNKLQSYADGIIGMELYTKAHDRLVPLDDLNLSSRLKDEWIERAEREQGGLVWVGRTPGSPHDFLAIRSVSLFHQSFASGGYLLIQVSPYYFQLANSIERGSYMVLLDQNQELITSNYPKNLKEVLPIEESRVTIEGSEFIIVKQKSRSTGWTVAILTPVDTLMKGVMVLQTATFLSGLIGVLLFIILSYFLSTMITKPINKLTKAIKQRKEGELLLTPATSSTSEVQELNHAYNHMAKEINHLIQVVYEKELVRSRAELKALQSQINPHFLYNTLNAIYWSLEERGEEELGELIIALSDLFRYTIDDHSKNEWVTIKQELDHIEKYMQLMKFRLQHFTWEILLTETYEQVKIPKLTFQPLVENAILHGFNKQTEAGIITIEVGKSTRPGWLLCKITDNGQGMDKELVQKLMSHMEMGKTTEAKGSGIALINVNQRLKLYYKDHPIEGIKIKSEVNKGTCFHFEVPIQGAES
ncbi:sensor histidine kinase [Ammoniphilus sp. YIM 78166]|uniref:cache domain-containing sensor histidine kinase n=1 Tax=Ammoniphilus sp. YIM 78166 TaxID=1644106 RepID=UPI0014313CBB|nr:sensor histidine kinase [Ammoniphilus sp. YIM 78166]